MDWVVPLRFIGAPSRSAISNFSNSRWISQFVVESTELKNGNAAALTATNSKPESIEQDGPSEIFRDEDDSKVGWKEDLLESLAKLKYLQCTSPNEHTTDEEGNGQVTIEAAAAAAAAAEEDEAQKETDYRQRLRRELVSRDGHGWVWEGIRFN